MPDESTATVAWPEPTPLSTVLAEHPSGCTADDRVVDFTNERLADQAMRDRGLVPMKNALPSVSAEPVAQKENSNHRLLAMLFAQGGDAKTAFADLGGQFDTDGRPVPGTGLFSLEYIRRLRRTQWFQEVIIELLDSKGGKLIENRLQIEVAPSIATLVEIRDNEAASASARLTAANSLLDRFLGKPKQAVEVIPPSDVAKFEVEREKLEAELERLREERKHLNAAVEHEPTI
jgi:hypothetical protein